MESMVNGGWVKLYRELKSKSIWQLSSPEQKVVLITILLLANHEENKWEWKDNQYVCKPGQLITSLNSLVRECGQGVTIQNVRTALERFEKLGFLTNTSTRTPPWKPRKWFLCSRTFHVPESGQIPDQNQPLLHLLQSP